MPGSFDVASTRATELADGAEAKQGDPNWLRGCDFLRRDGLSRGCHVVPDLTARRQYLMLSDLGTHVLKLTMACSGSSLAMGSCAGRAA